MERESRPADPPGTAPAIESLGERGFRRALGPFDAAMVVIGGIVGAGIFINPYIVAQRLDTPALVLSAWVAGGLIALAGAFAFAELGALLPRAGGPYIYLRTALRRFAASL
jgi:APA family basic amino acid/polyamine antiporter